MHNTLHHGGQPIAVVAPIHSSADRGFLEPPQSDTELLMYRVLISDVLHALSDRVGDWAIALGAAGLPTTVTSSSTRSAETVRHYARSALHAGAALEHELAHARSLAARGLTFTGV